MPLDFCCLYILCILFNALPFQMMMMMMIITVIKYWFIHIKICIVITLFFRGFCDAPKPGGPLTTRQPAEFYVSHVMRPIHMQKRPLGPTHHIHKMYILYKNDLITIYTKLGFLAQNFTKIQDKASLAISSPLRPRMRPIPKCVFGT